jgi:hypothetical protein
MGNGTFDHVEGPENVDLCVEMWLPNSAPNIHLRRMMVHDVRLFRKKDGLDGFSIPNVTVIEASLRIHIFLRATRQIVEYDHFVASI